MAPNPSVSARWQLGKLGGHSVSEAANQARSVCVKLIQIVLQWNVKNVQKENLFHFYWFPSRYRKY